jgi:pectate disaccharide-lyase
MKRKNTLVALALLFFLFSGLASAQIVEGFESGLPTTKVTTETAVTLGSGIWTLNNGVQGTNKYSGSYALTLSSGGYITTPVLDHVISISYYVKPSGSSTATLMKSVNGGAFDTVGKASISSGSFALINFTINDTNSNIRLKLLNASTNTHYVDQVTISTKATIPGITVSTTSLPDFGLVQAGIPSASASLTVSAINLSQNLIITPPAGYQVSTDNTTFSNPLTITPVSKTVAATTLYVRYAPATPTGLVKGDIQFESSGASTQIVSVKAIGIGLEPTAQSAVTFGTVTGNSVVVNLNGGNGGSRILVAKVASAVDWVPTDGVTALGINSDFSNATDQANGNRVVYAGTGNSVTVTGLAVGTSYYFASYEYNGGTAVNSENYFTVNPGVNNTATLTVAGLFVNPGKLAFGNQVKLIPSAEKSYSLSGAYLTPASGTISVTAPSGFEVSTTSGSGFGSTANISYTNSSLTATNVYVRFNPQAITSYSGSIVNNGGGASDLNVAVTGKGTDSTILFVKVYYISPSGNDNNAGTIDAPWASVSKAMAVAKGADTIYMRGGTYNYSTTHLLSNSGSAGKMICLFNYPGESPVLDFSTQTYGADYRAFLLTGNYWYIKGLEICHAGDNGIKLEGSYNRIERCVFHHNGDTGIQLGFGHTTENPDGLMCAYNLVYNCDSYLNFDKDSNGGDADGFACKMHNGKDNVFRGCRSWHNSDDGWDLFETDWSVYIDSCWTWHNGDKADFGGVAGNGNGFKLGGNGTGGNSKGVHYVTNCIALNVLVRGFDQNSHQGGVSVHNCLAIGCAYSYMFEKSSSSGVINEFKNCAEFGHTGAEAYEFASDVTTTYNTWDLGITTTASDFNAITEAAAQMPRDEYGRLPKTFGQLVSGSALIDKGTDVGIPYAGKAPDLGATEYGIISDVKNSNTNAIKLKGFDLAQNYPNPFNPATTIQFSLENTSLVVLKIYDITGNEVATLLNENLASGTHKVNFNASHLSSGVYFARLQAGTNVKAIKLTLLK